MYDARACMAYNIVPIDIRRATYVYLRLKDTRSDGKYAPSFQRDAGALFEPVITMRTRRPHSDYIPMLSCLDRRPVVGSIANELRSVLDILFLFSIGIDRPLQH